MKQNPDHIDLIFVKKKTEQKSNVVYISELQQKHNDLLMENQQLKTNLKSKQRWKTFRLYAVFTISLYAAVFGIRYLFFPEYEIEYVDHVFYDEETPYAVIQKYNKDKSNFTDVRKLYPYMKSANGLHHVTDVKAGQSYKIPIITDNRIPWFQ